MKRVIRTPVLLTLVVAAVSLLLGVGIASAAAKPTAKPAYEGTYQMYAEVARDGALGSSYDATNVLVEESDGPVYYVYFKNPVANCVAVVQPGTLGPPSETPLVNAYSQVTPVSGRPDVLLVGFGLPNSDYSYADPFMLVVTCSS